MPGQLISPSFDVTVPLPVPAGFTVSVNRCTLTLKVAVTDRAPLIVTVQVVLVVVQLPLQPAKVDPVLGVAVSLTIVPLG